MELLEIASAEDRREFLVEAAAVTQVANEAGAGEQRKGLAGREARDLLLSRLRIVVCGEQAALMTILGSEALLDRFHQSCPRLLDMARQVARGAPLRLEVGAALLPELPNCYALSSVQSVEAGKSVGHVQHCVTQLAGSICRLLDGT